MLTICLKQAIEGLKKARPRIRQTRPVTAPRLVEAGQVVSARVVVGVLQPGMPALASMLKTYWLSLSACSLLHSRLRSAFKTVNLETGP